MKLSEYLAGLEGACTANELEQAIQRPCGHPYHGRTWTRICRVRIARGQAICEESPLGFYVPKFDSRRNLSVCGETYKVGRGQNSTGVRYAWHSAEQFAIDVLKRNGLTQVAAHRIWDVYAAYPHRCLPIVESALAGKLPDPKLDTLVHLYSGDPIRYTLAENEADEGDKRAHRPCPACEGTLFDWGAGHSSGFAFVNWHCNGCGNAYCEHMTNDRLTQLRNPGRHLQGHGVERV